MTAKNEDPKSVSFPVLRLKQPIGEFYIGVIKSTILCEITDFDVRRILRERDFETYLGIQRPLNPKRVREIEHYVSTLDACFPTAVILSVDGRCASYDGSSGNLILSNFLGEEESDQSIPYRMIAKVIDGQHRIEGLKSFGGADFEVNVCIFVDIDVAQEGYIFATVNLAQTKVNKSLAYDLFELAQSRSPQKLCHNIAVALDQNAKSALHHRIKRLGVATEGRFNETLTQATFVESLMRYISRNPAQDRDTYLRGKTPHKANAEESQSLIFRNMMVDKKDMDIAEALFNYFGAVSARWPQAWDSTGRGLILNKTSGFRALMRFLREAYLQITGPGGVPSREQFQALFDRIKLKDEDFNTDRFKPGTSGEVTLYRALKELCAI
jgi:DGQHR domain-containing protein